jgi:hypothetical protein
MLVLSQHAEVRAKQRGLRTDDIRIVCEHGTQTERGYIFTKKDAVQLEAEARDLIRRAARLRGVLVPVAEGVIKTAFKATHAQQRQIL